MEIEGASGLVFRIEDIKRLALQPGDILIIRAPDGIRAQDAAQVREKLQALVPEHRVIVLARGWELESVRPAEDDRPAPP